MTVPADRRHFLRRSALASICLILVAGLHVGRVWLYGQTPWKGGGFGMFSTVDAEHARFLRVYLLADGRELPIRLPEAFAKRELVLRAVPSEAGANELAERLLKLRWQRRSEHWQAIAARIEEQPADVPLTGERLHVAPPLHVGDVPAAGQGSDWEPVAANLSGGIKPDAVRIEVWRQRFDEAGPKLHAERLFQVTRTVAEVQP